MKKLLIVGATSDIGRAIARRYGEAGSDLILAARAAERLAKDATDLKVRYPAISVETLDLDILDIERHEQVLDGLGALPDTVISVVGLLGDHETSSADAGTARRVMETNYTAPALFLEAVARRMAVRGNGTIIGISSVAGDRGRGSNYTYGSAKAGFTAFLSGLRNRLAKSGVHVVTVKPGFVDTKMTEGMALPSALTAKPEEVAAAIYRADERRRNVIYVRPVWRMIMTIIRLIPEPVFKRLRL